MCGSTRAAVCYPPPAMPLRVVSHPVIEDSLARLRDRDTPCDEFRRLARRVSLLLAAEATRGLGARHVRLLSIVAAPEGVAHLESAVPDAIVYTAALDRELNDRKYILPGLGDFGDRLFGT